MYYFDDRLNHIPGGVVPPYRPAPRPPYGGNLWPTPHYKRPHHTRHNERHIVSHILNNIISHK